MDWSLAGNIAQVVSVVVLLPIGAAKWIKSLEKRLDDQDERLIRIESQFHRNGGLSMKDDMVAMKSDISFLKGQFSQHIEENKE